MTDQLQAAAKAGDIKAIESLMNKAFESKGLTVRVTNSGTLLKVVVRGKSAPDKALLPTIKAGLANISPQGFEQFLVTARATGKSNAWSYQGDFTNDEKPSPKPKMASAPPAPKPKPLPKVDSLPPKSEIDITVSNTNNNSETSKSWYQQSWLIISSLILFPLAGIPLTWASKWPKDNKVGASIASGLWFLLLLISTSLSKPQTTTAQEENQSPATELAVAPENEAPAPAPAPVTDRSFADAVNAAMAASEAAQAASTPSEWQNVADLWDKAIELMKAVPVTNENYQLAQQKATEYSPSLNYARQNANTQTHSRPNSEPNPTSKVLANLIAESDDNVNELVILSSHLADHGKLSQYIELDALGRGFVAMTILNAWIMEGKIQRNLTLEEEQEIITDLTLVLSEAAKSYPEESILNAANVVATRLGIFE